MGVHDANGWQASRLAVTRYSEVGETVLGSASRQSTESRRHRVHRMELTIIDSSRKVGTTLMIMMRA